MKNKTVALLGVDGSGKSTAVENLKALFGEKCEIIYMGYKDFDDPRITRLDGRRVAMPFVRFLIYRCYWRRFLYGVKMNKIIIFDRYVHEVFINSTGYQKWINTLLYKYLFPKPRLIIYLHCPVSESLKRKTDIPNAENFEKMKERFDRYFLTQKGVLCLDTYDMSIEEITNTIYNHINQSFDL